jgi:hypothetical protein
MVFSVDKWGEKPLKRYLLYHNPDELEDYKLKGGSRIRAAAG